MSEAAVMPLPVLKKRGKLLQAVYELMRDGDWRTLGEIRYGVATKGVMYTTEASVSARLRDLRKPIYGGWDVVLRRANNGWQYRMVPR